MKIRITGLYTIFHQTNNYDDEPDEWYLAVFHAALLSEQNMHTSDKALEVRKFREIPENFMGKLGRDYGDLK